MNIFRIVRRNNYYRVDQRHHILWIFRYWDIGARDLCPKYCFSTKYEAIKAIRDIIGDKAVIYIKTDKFVHYE